jgi:hypothetical protein
VATDTRSGNKECVFNEFFRGVRFMAASPNRLLLSIKTKLTTTTTVDPEAADLSQTCVRFMSERDYYDYDTAIAKYVELINVQMSVDFGFGVVSKLFQLKPYGFHDPDN